MRVSDQGTVVFDTAQLTQAERTVLAHDPDFQQTARTRANEWAEKLVQAVKAVTDADDGIRMALDAAVLDSDPIDGTFNGFNRSPQDSPYPSLEEAGKAADMPKDRKDVPAWWQSLDPVTRGILLEEARRRTDEARPFRASPPAGLGRHSHRRADAWRLYVRPLGPRHTHGSPHRKSSRACGRQVRVRPASATQGGAISRASRSTSARSRRIACGST
ncbi:hypothetical protein [Streptomyces viridochromogenes]|uniref:hypothetical protein n=1 Tax=Streptomyces viridochromogenes TaxID=1938 RepID=UPI00069EC72D|nr:hypothetical protein [Streptomyces viridochromogenes]